MELIPKPCIHRVRMRPGQVTELQKTLAAQSCAQIAHSIAKSDLKDRELKVKSYTGVCMSSVVHT
eukprot:scaffold443953_cov33-Prasinocladus_malaysianus.AAC.1